MAPTQTQCVDGKKLSAYLYSKVHIQLSNPRIIPILCAAPERTKSRPAGLSIRQAYRGDKHKCIQDPESRLTLTAASFHVSHSHDIQPWRTKSNNMLLPHRNGPRPVTSVDLLNPSISLLGDFGVSPVARPSDWPTPPRSNRIDAGRELWSSATWPISRRGRRAYIILSTGPALDIKPLSPRCSCLFLPLLLV